MNETAISWEDANLCFPKQVMQVLSAYRKDGGLMAARGLSWGLCWEEDDESWVEGMLSVSHARLSPEERARLRGDSVVEVRLYAETGAGRTSVRLGDEHIDETGEVFFDFWVPDAVFDAITKQEALLHGEGEY